MMEAATVVGLLVAVIAAIFAYLQWNHPKAPKTPATSSPVTSALKRVLETKVLRVGFFHYPPLINYNETADGVVATGIYAEVLQHFAAQQSLRIQWRPINLSQAIPAVLRAEVDCYACIMMSDVRYRECDFVGLLHSIALVGIVRKDDQTVKHPSDLTHRKDIKVAVCQGEIGHHTATTTLRIPSRRLVEVNSADISEIIAQVREGIAKVALADGLSCKRMMKAPHGKKEFKLVFADPPILTVPNGFMIPKGDAEFHDWLDAGIRLAFTTFAGKNGDEILRAEFGSVITRIC